MHFVPIGNMKSIYLCQHEFYCTTCCASKNSLSRITAVKCTVYRIPITQHAASEFLSLSMQNFTFHHWNSYHALKFNCIFILKWIFYIETKRSALNVNANTLIYAFTSNLSSLMILYFKIITCLPWIPFYFCFHIYNSNKYQQTITCTFHEY